MKNQYFLLLIDKTLHCLEKVKHFTELNLINAYY